MILPETLDIDDKDELIQLFEQVNVTLSALIISKLMETNNNYGEEIFNTALSEMSQINLNAKNLVKTKYNDMIIEDMQSYKSLFEYKGQPFELNQYNLEVLNAGIKTTNSTLNNLSGTVAFASQTAYVNALDEAYAKVYISGVDYKTAIQDAVKKLVSKGITLKDSLGRSIQLKTAVKRNLLMGLQQTANKINENIADELGCNGYETTAHTGARLTHQVWQGRQFAITREDAEKYGVGLWADIKDELYDYNCRHHYSGIILGISEPAYTEEELKEMQDPDLNERLELIRTKQSQKYELQRSKKIYEKSGIDANSEISKINAQINKINQEIKFINQYTVKEQQALNDYISSKSIGLNEKLRNNIALTDDELEFVANLDSALSKTSNYNGTIVRVLEMYDPEIFVKQLALNEEYSTNQYLSFSNKEGHNDNANIKIYIANSKYGKNLTTINKIGENEVLYQRNKKFKTLNIEEKNDIIYVLWEEIE